MSEGAVTKEDFRELARELREGQETIRTEIKGFGEALNKHALEDARDMTSMKEKLASLSNSSDDRHRFMRGWLGGLLAVAIASGLGFLFRSAIDVQTARPVSGWSQVPSAPPSPPAAIVK